MTKFALLLIASAVVLLGVLSWKTAATALSAPLPPAALSGSRLPVQKAGCLLAGRYCGVGYHWVCGLPPNPERRRCKCVACEPRAN